MSKKRILLLGSTGSIGVQTLRIVDRYPERFEVVGLAAGRNISLLAQQTGRYHPRVVAVADPEAGRAFADMTPEGVGVLAGPLSLAQLCREVEADIAVVAVVGIAALPAVEAALQMGLALALANKESLVSGGALVTRLAREKNVPILPVDSEHSAIFQCLHAGRREDVTRLWLTASGGPFWDWPQERLANAAREDALRHPNWSMGDKITIDSATMMNKGLEVIEARWLYDIPPENIRVAIHRRSIVHSMVEFADGALVAQMGVPDMALPIQYALTYPERLPTHNPPLDPYTCGALEFLPPDNGRFPCLPLAYKALAQGKGRCVVMNAANEEAVARFLHGDIRFTDIADRIEWAMAHMGIMDETRLNDILALDDETRRVMAERK